MKKTTKANIKKHKAAVWLNRVNLVVLIITSVLFLIYLSQYFTAINPGNTYSLYGFLLVFIWVLAVSYLSIPLALLIFTIVYSKKLKKLPKLRKLLLIKPVISFVLALFMLLQTSYFVFGQQIQYDLSRNIKADNFSFNDLETALAYCNVSGVGAHKGLVTITLRSGDSLVTETDDLFKVYNLANKYDSKCPQVLGAGTGNTLFDDKYIDNKELSNYIGQNCDIDSIYLYDGNFFDRESYKYNNVEGYDNKPKGKDTGILFYRKTLDNFRVVTRVSIISQSASSNLSQELAKTPQKCSDIKIINVENTKEYISEYSI